MAEGVGGHSHNEGAHTSTVQYISPQNPLPHFSKKRQQMPPPHPPQHGSNIPMHPELPDHGVPGKVTLEAGAAAHSPAHEVFPMYHEAPAGLSPGIKLHHQQTNGRLPAGNGAAQPELAKGTSTMQGRSGSLPNLAIDVEDRDDAKESEPCLGETGNRADATSASSGRRKGNRWRNVSSPSTGLGYLWPGKPIGTSPDEECQQTPLREKDKKGMTPLSIPLQPSGPSPESTPFMTSSPTPSTLTPSSRVFSPWRTYHTDSSPTWIPPIFSPVLPSVTKKLEMVSSGVQSRGAMAAMCYTASSCSMILVNKMVLSGYQWEAHVSLMVFQNALVTALVLLLRWGGLVPREPIPWRLIRMWLPVNLLFIGMLVTSFFSLQFLQVAMATILKNCTNLLTALGESFLSNTRHGFQVWMALFLMIGSAICAGITDLSFHGAGYSWQFLNCVLTASYVLTLRHVMKSARQHTSKGAPLGEFTMVLLNSALSLPFGLILAFSLGEFRYVAESPLIRLPGFWFAATLSGLLGLAISFSSMWCLHMTSPTTFSLIGSFNKIPLAVLGILMFNAPSSVSNTSSIFVGLMGGILFAQAKVRQSQRSASRVFDSAQK